MILAFATPCLRFERLLGLQSSKRQHPLLGNSPTKVTCGAFVFAFLTLRSVRGSCVEVSFRRPRTQIRTPRPCRFGVFKPLRFQTPPGRTEFQMVAIIYRRKKRGPETDFLHPF